MTDTGPRGARRPGAAPCPFPWCTTAHGATLHEHDEDHRSAGEAVVITVRGADPASDERSTEVEVGLMRRRSELETWLVIEDGRALHAEITVSSARAVLHALRSEPSIARELGLAPAGDP